MRRIVFLMVTLLAMSGARVNAQTVKGNLNGDGCIDRGDVICLVYRILGLDDGNDAYDINEDGKVDISDVSCLIGIIASNLQDNSLLACPDDNHPHTVDLGLPSGTKWACCNVGASKPEDCGGYYAWGETEEKAEYTWNNYVHCDGTQGSCHFLGDISYTEYDVAQVKWGDMWFMPTETEANELCMSCSVETVCFHNIICHKYTGPNGNYILIPYAGKKWYSTNSYEDNTLMYWTSSQLPGNHFQAAFFNMGYGLLPLGLPVRPVYAPSSSFTLSEEAVDLFVNGTVSVSIEMGSGRYELQCDQTDIIDAELIMADKEEYPDAKDEISIYGVAEGTAQLKVVDKKYNKTVTIDVNVKTPTDEDLATTKDYVERVMDYINSQEELEIYTFQSSLVSWLEEQNWVKNVNVDYDNDIVPNVSQNKTKHIIQKLKAIIARIDIKFKNGDKFYIDFIDWALLNVHSPTDNLDLPSYPIRDVSYVVGENLVNNTKVLYIQGRTMPSFEKQNESTAERENSLIQQSKQLSPVALDITSKFKSLSFLEEDMKEQGFGMILLGQTHGSYSNGNRHAGFFHVEDHLFPYVYRNSAITLYYNNGRIREKEKLVYNVLPVAIENQKIKDNTIFYSNYCFSYNIQDEVPQTTFFGYNSTMWYQYGSYQMAEFFYNMSMGDTYENAIEPMLKPYSFLPDDSESTKYVIPVSNKEHSKQRYFSISTDDVTDYTGSGPVITGKINGYKNLKSGIDYFVYVSDKGEKLDPVDITNKGKRITIEEDGSFRYEYPGLITESPEVRQYAIGFKYSGITYRGSIKTLVTKSLCPDGNHPHMIDLGLPSGTKWACCNVGASTPKQYGGYYAWGETQAKSMYNWETYQHGSFWDHVVNIGSDIGGTQYDAATANWGAPWRMPSLSQIQELLNNATSVWTTQNGVNGRKFIGTNSGTIFLPAAGYRRKDELYSAGEWVGYWSSTLDELPNPHEAFGLVFDCYGAYWQCRGRSYGQSVRPCVNTACILSPTRKQRVPHAEKDSVLGRRVTGTPLIISDGHK